VNASAELRVFFYGSFMNTKVLEEKGVAPRATAAARLNDWALVFQPMANVIPASGEEVYGMVTTVDRESLENAYRGDPLETYEPRDVEVERLDGVTEAVCCYSAPRANETKPSAGYLELLIEAAREHALPDFWMERLSRVDHV
jgi:AIG2 family protein